MEKKIEPLSNVKPIWDHDYGGYPDRVRLAMNDGNIVTYWLEVKQPAPTVFPEYVGKHIKRTGGQGSVQPVRADYSADYSTESAEKP